MNATCEADSPETDESPEQELGSRSVHGYTGLRGDDLLEIERWASIASLYVLAGVDVSTAWQRANEWLAEHPDELPECVRTEEPAAAKMPGSRLVELVTEPSRRVAPPIQYLDQLARRAALNERSYVVDSEEREAPDGTTPEGDETITSEAAELPPYLRQRLTPGARSKSEAKRLAVQRGEPLPIPGVVHRDVKPPITAAKEPQRRIPMAETLREKLTRVLPAGPKTTRELCDELGEEPQSVGSMLRRMVNEGLVSKEDTYGGAWSWIGGKPAKTMADVAAKAATKPRKAKATNGNGHAAPPPPPATELDPVKAALLALKDAILQKQAGQLAAIETLLKG